MSEIATMADVEAIEQVPLDERGLPSNTYEALRRGAAIAPDQVALSFFLQAPAYDRPVRFTFRELFGRITQTANMFHDLGIAPTDVVSMILPNLPEAHFTIWGGEAAGIVNPINPLLEPDVIADIMRAAGTKVLVTLAPFPNTDIWQKVARIADHIPTLETIVQVNVSHYVPGVKGVVARGVAWKEGRGARVRARVLDFHKTVQHYPDDQLVSGRTIDPDEIAAYFHTGGTTGTPKLARHTHFNEVFDAWASAQFLSLGPDKVMFCGLPLFHVNAVIVTGLIPWTHGTGVVLGTPQGYRAPGLFENFWKIVEHYEVSFFSGVPTVYSALLNVPIGNSDVSPLEYAICGAAPMPVEVFREFERRTGIRILEGYGLTEGTCVSSVNPPAGERRIGSIGFRLPYQPMRVVELDDQGNYVRDCAPNEIGVIIVQGPNVFAGYREEVHNRSAWVEPDDGSGRWLNTGDLGRQDEDGYFWLTGRRKELIIRGGHNIDPKLIEEPLHRHPAVALAAAVGRPDPRAGELPVAYVQLAPGESATEEELLQFAREHVGERAAIPKAIRIVEKMPQTAVGKIFKPALQWREVEDVYAEEVGTVAGVEEVHVEVGSDKLHGMKAEITVRAAPDVSKAELEARIHQTLGRYTVRYDVKIT